MRGFFIVYIMKEIIVKKTKQITLDQITRSSLPILLEQKNRINQKYCIVFNTTQKHYHILDLFTFNTFVPNFINKDGSITELHNIINSYINTGYTASVFESKKEFINYLYNE